MKFKLLTDLARNFLLTKVISYETEGPTYILCFKLAPEQAGFIVDVYNDPLKPLSDYRAGKYDLILLDIKMPAMSGFQLYNKIKEIDDNVTVCFITAFEEYYDEFKKRFPYSDETECFIRKPVGIEELIRKVKSSLNYN